LSEFLILEKLTEIAEHARFTRLECRAMNDKLATLIQLQRERIEFEKTKIAAIVPNDFKLEQ
jgi:hypothetical protein